MLGIHATITNRLRFMIANWVLGSSKPFYFRNPLTDLPTRQAFDVAKREGGYFAFFVDLDNLKEINQKHGYFAGDLAIKAVAESIIQHVRKTDLVSHWGGDEFAVLLHDTSRDAAKDIAERILTHINELGFQVSIGLGSSVEAAQSSQQIAKARGKNQVSYLSPRVPPWDQDQNYAQLIPFNL